MLKRILAGGLAVVMACSLFTGCGSSGASSSAGALTAIPEEAKKDVVSYLTDGAITSEETCRYSARRVKEMIRRQKEKYGWEFLFLGANIDAVETAGHLGIAPDRAVNYHCDSEGTRLNYEVMGQAVSAVRCSAPLDEHWKDAIEEDFRKRQKTGRR